MATILLVDDNYELLNVMSAVLIKAGYAVITAVDGNKALNIIRGRERVDMIITDQRMPGMDGIELARLIRETDQAVPILFMTGEGELEDYLHARDLGIVRFLQKPVGLREILSIVREAMARGAAARSHPAVERCRTFRSH